MRDDQRDFRELLLAYARGDKRLADLPTTEPRFWAETVVRATRPGRSSLRAPGIGATAERLLRGPLAQQAEQARVQGVIAALSDRDVRVRREAIHLLRESRVTPEVIQAAAGAVQDPDREVQVGALFLLATGGAGQATQELVDILVHNSDFRSTIASGALVELGEKAVPSLAALLDNPDVNVRWRATRCLAQIRHPSAKEALLKAFHDDSASVAWVAADGLLSLGPSVRLDVLRSVLQRALTTSVIRALHHYAEHSVGPPFRKIEHATTGLAAGSATLTAVNEALEELEKAG